MNRVIAYLAGEIISTNDSLAHSLYKKSWFGEPTGDKIRYSFSEALYLLEKGKIEILFKNKKISFKDLLKKLERKDTKISLKYTIFKNLRNRGYIPKTALKFGADFRIYEKGAKLRNKHAKWLLFAEHESKKLSWHDFSAKNRVAHSTRKNLLIAIVDEEDKITYYEVSWIKP